MGPTEGFSEAVVAVFKEALDERGVSYRDIEQRSGMNRGTISHRLSGDQSLTADALMELCAGAGLDVSSILCDAYKRI